MEKNYKQLIMSALYSDANGHLPTEAIKWVDSNLPNDNTIGSNTSPKVNKVADLFSDFPGFTKEDMRSKEVPQGTAIAVSNELLLGIMDKFKKAADGIHSDKHEVDETTMLTLVKDLSQAELGVVILTGIAGFGERFEAIQKEMAYEMWKRGMGFGGSGK